MSKPRYTYAVVFVDYGTVIPVHSLSHVPLQFAHGYLESRNDEFGPKLGARILRSDGKIMGESAQRTTVSLGMVAGFPSAEQYEHAAQNALEKAAAIRERTCV